MERYFVHFSGNIGDADHQIDREVIDAWFPVAPVSLTDVTRVMDESVRFLLLRVHIRKFFLNITLSLFFDGRIEVWKKSA